MLVKQPAFTTIAVLTLALGIGANTAIFSVVNAVLLRPLPYPHSEQLILLRERLTGPNGFESGSVSYPNYLDWRAGQRSFTDLALVRAEGVNLSATDAASPPERIRAARITANYLSILQVPPRLGRDFVAKDDQPGAAKVVLISERLWRNHFGALPLALGQRLNIDGVPREIIVLFRSGFVFRATPIFSFRWRICARTMIFFRGGITRAFPALAGLNQT
jgi:putative ABC transport system permease protein